MASRKELPRHGTQARSLLELAAISGELPINQARRLIGDGKYYEKVITRLRTKGLITSHRKDNLCGYRLTRKAKVLLLGENQSRFDFYLTGAITTNHVRSEYRDRLRLYRMAEVYVTMRGCGAAVFLDEKPPVFYPADGEELDLPEIEAPAFYSSREIKAMGLDVAGIRGARAVGILLSPEHLFITYNAVKDYLKIDYKPEMRMKALARTTLCGDRLSHQYAPEQIRGLLFAGSMELAGRLMSESITSKRNYFIFDGGYEHFHFLTNDHKGEVLLKILCNADLYGELHDLLSVGLQPRNPGSVFENDAVDDEGQPVLFAFDCDLSRISRFNQALLTHDGAGTLICFDFQADALRQACCEGMAFQTIGFEKFERRFFIDNSARLPAEDESNPG